jgi:hypothetical protein
VSVRLVKLKENFTSTEYLRTDCPWGNSQQEQECQN